MIIDAALYKAGHRLPSPFDLEGAADIARAEDTFCWIGLFEPTDDEFADVAHRFELHELAVEDAVEAHQRPKLDVYEDTLLAVLKPARYDDDAEQVVLGEIIVLVSDHFVIAVRHGEASRLAEVRRDLERRPDDLAFGPGSVLLDVLDRVVDDYVPVLEGLEADIRELEEQVFSPETGAPTERIYRLKRQVLHFRQATQPLLDPIDRLARSRFVAIEPGLREYYRDVHDHLLRVVERVAAAGDLLTSILEANLTQVSVRQNEDMRKISAWVAMAAVPTLLAGIWGMNFAAMPELDEWWGYPLALSLMAVIVIAVYVRFKRSGWL